MGYHAFQDDATEKGAWAGMRHVRPSNPQTECFAWQNTKHFPLNKVQVTLTKLSIDTIIVTTTGADTVYVYDKVE